MAIVIATTLVIISTLWREGLRFQVKSLNNLAISLSEETSRAFQAIELVQTGIADALRNAGVTSPEALAGAMSPRSAHDQLRARISGLPFIDALSLMDNKGHVLVTTRVWPAPPVDNNDRLYFQILESGPPGMTYLTEPMTGRISHLPNIFLGRRIDAPDGQFLGVLLTALDRFYLEATLSHLDLGPGGLIALVRTDGTVLASAPPLSPAAGTASGAAQHGRQRIAAALAALPPGGGRLSAGILDDHERLSVVRHIKAGVPVSVIVSDTTEAVEATLLRMLLPIVVAALLFCLLIGLAAIFVARHLRDQRELTAFERHMARTDPLTGLPNRLRLTEQIDHLLTHERDTPFALLFLDLDSFKVINDTLGHDVGNTLLQAVARRLTETLQADGLLARLGGDEFAIVRKGIREKQGARDLATAVVAAIGAPHLVDRHRLAIGCSVGITISPRDGDSVLSLLKNADLALYAAKSEGRGAIREFSDRIAQAAKARQELQFELDEAWRLHQFHLVYQPIFDAATRRLAGFEALLRWQHPVRGQVSPADFIPVVEETGLIMPIGAWVLEEACRAAMSWPDHLFISINLSPVQFRDGKVTEQVLAALARTGLPSRRLELEITESVLLNEGATVHSALDALRREGITIALDDFGTGYSSLSYLHNLPIGRIKVDRLFVQGAGSSPSNRAILHAVLGLSHALSLTSTAEGIETEEQVSLMKLEGCTHLQAFLLGRPASAEAALRLACAAA
ncbi:putative bifunctional diguanylate cyclase/phosphodiesterase [Xanthobacter sp. AM11]|uniref:putative bifunctional diguanylate cyclase/phosphodiesterase n=1 Tax=Xanthobacter sp. AM11 TaxID=3380643 RepID=UPI0039BF454F